jgi:hypothetical protein
MNEINGIEPSESKKLNKKVHTCLKTESVLSCYVYVSLRSNLGSKGDTERILNISFF